MPSMKKHILSKHPITWQHWKSASSTFVIEKNHWKKGKLRFHVDYEAITKHFGSVNPYRKDNVQQK
jgi:hypothetical protein